MVLPDRGIGLPAARAIDLHDAGRPLWGGPFLLFRALFDLARYTRGTSQVHAGTAPLGKKLGPIFACRMKKGPKNPISVGRRMWQGFPVGLR
jgi:hypothetical protein